jgi:hypothetical protein
MSLDVPIPDPPTLASNVDADAYDDVEVQGQDYRRDELTAFLEAGAWATAFEGWAAETQLGPAGYEIVEDLALLAEFDFFWDGFAGRVGYHAPGIPEDWKVREVHPALDSWETVSSINASLTELGQRVCDVLADEYIDWDTDFEAPDDLPEF